MNTTIQMQKLHFTKVFLSGLMKGSEIPCMISYPVSSIHKHYDSLKHKENNNVVGKGFTKVTFKYKDVHLGEIYTVSGSI